MSDAQLSIVITAEAAEALARLREAQAQMRGFGTAQQQAAASARGLSGDLGRVSGALGGLATGALAAGAAFLSWQAVSGFLRGSIGAFAEAERQQLVLAQTIAATGGAAGRTAQDVERLVQAHARSGAATADSVRGAATQLLTFRSISGDVFDRTLSAAVDLAAVGFGSVESAAVQLGKAMESPAQGLAALARVGVSFSEEQKRVIQSMVDAGRTAEAQAEILKAVEGQVGGAGRAQGQGLAGAFRALGHELGEFGETVGGELARLIGLESALRWIAGGVSAVRQAIGGREPRTIDQIKDEIARLTEARDALAATLADLPSTPGGILALDLGSAETEVETLTARWRELRAEIERSRDEGYRDDRPETTVLAELVQTGEALRAAEKRVAEIRRALFDLELDQQAPTGSLTAARDLAALEAALAAEQAALEAALAERAEAERRAAEEQARIAAERVDGVLAGLRQEAEAARRTREEVEALKAAARAGVDPEADPEAYRKILDLVRQIAAARAEAAGRAQLAEWQQRAEIARVEAEYGRDSVEAARARAAAEREALVARLEEAGVAGELRDAILAAHDAARSLAAVDMGGPIARARAEAAALAGDLARAFATVQGMIAADLAGAAEETLRARFRNDPVRLAGELARQRVLAAQAAARQGADAIETEALDRQLRAAIDAAEARAAAALANAPPPRSGRGGDATRQAAGDTLASLQAEAQALLSELDLRVAQIHERVQAGLMTVAEGERAVADAKERMAGGLADLLPRIDALGPAGEAMAERLRTALRSVAEEIRGGLGRSIEDAIGRLESAGESAFVSLIRGSRDAGRQIVDALITEFARLAWQQWFAGPFSTLVSGLFGAIGGLFGGVAAARGAVVAGGTVLPFARGGVPSGAEVVPSLAVARGRVVDRPTLFPLDGGRAGLMGEAGAEAILPLVRGPAGLSVRGIGPSGELALPLARGAGGALGVVVPFARGGVPRVPERLAAATRAMPAAPPPTAAAPPVVNLRVNVETRGGAGDERVAVRERAEGGDRVLDVVIERVAARLVQDTARGRGLAPVFEGLYGIARRGR